MLWLKLNLIGKREPRLFDIFGLSMYAQVRFGLQGATLIYVE